MSTWRDKDFFFSHLFPKIKKKSKTSKQDQEKQAQTLQIQRTEVYGLMTLGWKGSVGKGTILELSPKEERISTQQEKGQKEEKQKQNTTENPTVLMQWIVCFWQN